MVGSFDNEPVPEKQQSTIVNYSKRMTKQPTDAERAFIWVAEKIRHASKSSYIKQRTFFITKGFSFIVDYYFPKFKLAVELDGGSHNGEKKIAYDAWRDKLLLENEGVTVLRFKNEEILGDREDVHKRTVQALLRQPNATPFCIRELQRNSRAEYDQPWGGFIYI